MNKEEKLKTNITLVDDIREYVKNSENEKFLKVTICDEHKSIFDAILRKINTISNITILDVCHTTKKTIKQGTEEIDIEYYYTEISKKDVDKWNAIKYLIEKLGIKKEEVVAIGDNINDREMIKNAGVGIAMGQSMPEIKEVADQVTENNENEGVKKAIESL